MSVIAQAITDRQSEIDRLQAEIKALTDVEQILGASAPPARSTARRSPRKAAAAAPESKVRGEAEGGCRRPREQVRGEAGEKTSPDVGRGEEGGIRADDRLLGRTAKEGGQEVVGPALGGRRALRPGVDCPAPSPSAAFVSTPMNLRDRLVEVALEWQRRYGVAPHITTQLSRVRRRPLGRDAGGSVQPVPTAGHRRQARPRLPLRRHPLSGQGESPEREAGAARSPSWRRLATTSGTV